MENNRRITLWKELFGEQTEAFDYSGRRMSITADLDSLDYPVICLIRPKKDGGQEIEGNVVLCAKLTDLEKNETFPTWKANGQTFQAKRVKGTSNCYKIEVFL